MDILKSLDWNDSDEITITEKYGRLIIEKVSRSPNVEIIEDMERDMKDLIF